MFSGRLAVLALPGLLWLSACGPAQAFPGPVSTPDSAWTVRFVQTGGFAGVHYELQVSSSGQFTAINRRSGMVVSKPLSETNLQTLRHILAETDLDSSGRLPSECADCYIYDVEIASATGAVRIHTDDANLEGSGAELLIQFLSDLRDQALRSAD